jgi:hypothetical protein
MTVRCTMTATLRPAQLQWLSAPSDAPVRLMHPAFGPLYSDGGSRVVEDCT